MAIYKIFPTQDTTLYSLYLERNTGLDEIIEASLEVGAFIKPAPQASRFLIQFSSDEISDVINNRIAGAQWQSNLRCFTANVTALNYNTTLEIYPISQPWNMGTGRFGYLPEVTNGTSWVWRDYQGGTKWISGSLPPNITSSYTSPANIGGGTWYNIYSGSQTFSYYSNKDLNVNVTEIVTAWNSASIENNGFIVKQQEEFIDNEDLQPKIKYFSVDTHTIYPPCLEFKWIDATFNTSSLPIINVNPFVVTIGDNPGTFYLNSVQKFRVYSRPEFPVRTFSTASHYTQNYYLPISSSYAIKDLDTNEFVIDFDSTYTQLSQDEMSSYFTLYMNGLQSERYYKILIKTTVNGNTLILDDNYYFKIING